MYQDEIKKYSPLTIEDIVSTAKKTSRRQI